MDRITPLSSKVPFSRPEGAHDLKLGAGLSLKRAFDKAQAEQQTAARQTETSPRLPPPAGPTRRIGPSSARRASLTKEHRHGQDREESRQEGEAIPDQGRREVHEAGPLLMLTRFQIHERLGSLSGEIKAAREMKRETEQALADADKAVTIARQADEKAQAHIDRLETEARDLGQQYLGAVDQLIAAPVADETAPNVPVEFAPDYKGTIEGADFAFDTPERHADAFGGNHYTNGIDDAFERATNP